MVALDTREHTMKDFMFIIEATIRTLKYHTHEFSISKFTIQNFRAEKWNEDAEAIKLNYRIQIPDTVSDHKDGQLSLDARKSKEDRLPIIITYNYKWQ